MSFHREHRWALIIAGILAMATGYYVLKDSSSSISPRTLNFSIGKPEKITEFRISKAHEQLVVKRENDRWLVNDQFRVKENLPEVFLQTLNSVKVKAPASRTLRASLRDKLLKEGTRIDLYKGIFRVRSYYVYFDSLDTRITYFMKKGSKVPIGVEVPGLHLPLAGIFRTSVQYWKDRSVFFHSPEEIAYIDVDMAGDSARSFTVRRGNHGETALFARGSMKVIPGSDPLALNDFLSSFRKLEYLRPLEPGDSALSLLPSREKPLCTITMKATTQNPVILNIYPVYSAHGGGQRADAVYFVGTLSTEATPFLARYPDFDPVLRERSFFLKP